MASIIITGATGTVGSAALATALASPLVSHVTVLARRAPSITHEKLSTILIPSAEDPRGFESLSSDVVSQLKGNSAVIWALGISQTQVSKDEYVKITYEYTTEAARAFAPLGTPDKPFRFVFISGQGATQDESAYTLFGKVKGRTEKHLVDAETTSFKTVCLRPAGVIPAPSHAANVPWYVRTALGAFSVVLPSTVIKSTDIGIAAVELAAGTKGWDERDGENVIDNAKLKRMAEAYKKEMGV